MASRAEQKAAARAAREAKQAQLKAGAQRRQRLYGLGAIVVAAIVALVVVIVASSSGGGSKVKPHKTSTALTIVNSELAGIHQSGNVLGSPAAKVTITEYGDLVCPVCAAFAQTSEPQIIATLVKPGKAKLVFRGFETASGTANHSEYVPSQVAARAAGLQNLEWNYVLLTYEEQPQTINGTPAEQVPYITTAYLQSLASQIKGLDLAKWQSDTASQTLANAVNADGTAAQAAGATGTPTVIVTGPNGTFKDPNPIPTLAQIQADIKAVS